MEKYKKEKLIGSGSFGTVWLVKLKLTRIYYCVKEIDMIPLTEVEKQRTLNEVTVLSNCKHKNIIRYKDVIVDHASARLSIIMEYANGGDLSTAITNQYGVPFSESVILSWFIQICLALQYLHFKNILHRDLKTQNIFLTRNKTVKVGDFGIARILRDSEDLAKTAIGTPYYMSPEIIKRKPYNYKSDMWALGCVLFEMSALELPFKATSFFQLMTVILEGKRTNFPHWCSSLMKGMVQDLLKDDPNLRPSTEEILSYPLIQPYLSKYVLQRPSKAYEYPDVRIKKVPTSRTIKNTRDIFEERAASKSNMSAAKQTKSSETYEVQFQVQRKTRSTSVTAPAAEFQHAERKRIKTETKYTLPHKVPKASTKSPKGSNLPQKLPSMNITYVVPTIDLKKCSINSSLDMQSSNMLTTKDVDGGYHSAEGISYSSNDKTNATIDVNEHISKQSINGKEMFAGTSSVVHNTSFGFETESFESTFPRNKARVSDHFNCKHSQCNQCMIDMLWKNRIRGCVGTDVNRSEYFKLKDKLSLIFDNDLFQKVYQSLLCEWDGSEIGESAVAIQSFVKTLNYEQVQHLPLMMQLIQLDLLKSHFEDRKKSTSDDIDFLI